MVKPLDHLGVVLTLCYGLRECVWVGDWFDLDCFFFKSCNRIACFGFTVVN